MTKEELESQLSDEIYDWDADPKSPKIAKAVMPMIEKYARSFAIEQLKKLLEKVASNSDLYFAISKDDVDQAIAELNSEAGEGV